LQKRALEESTYVVRIAFYDEEGDAVIPKTLTWTLTDKVGDVVNSRSDVVVSGLDTSVSVVLSGEDLAISTHPSVDRLILFEGTYDSGLGNDLPFKGAAWFDIEELISV
jgi:hypothetical protein